MKLYKDILAEAKRYLTSSLLAGFKLKSIQLPAVRLSDHFTLTINQIFEALIDDSFFLLLKLALILSLLIIVS